MSINIDMTARGMAASTKKEMETKTEGLQRQINNIPSLGKFLSLWDCSTGLPETNPGLLPYTYTTGNYYIVSAISSTATDNLIPSGTQYNGTASTTHATSPNIPIVGDVYYYDGASWILQRNTANNFNIKNGSSSGSLRTVNTREEASGTYTLGTNAFTIGNGTQASHANSFAMGLKTVTTNNNQVVMGKHNLVEGQTDKALIIGGGQDSYTRINIFTLDWNGNAVYTGDVQGYANSTTHKLSDKLEQDDAITIWKSGISYKVNDVVVYYDSTTLTYKIFKCTTAHTSSSTIDLEKWADKNMDFSNRANGDLYGNPIHTTYQTNANLTTSFNQSPSDSKYPSEKLVYDNLATKANTSDVTTDLAGKVDKVSGKELSTNDYTNADKAKLDKIISGDGQSLKFFTNNSIHLSETGSSGNIIIYGNTGSTDVTVSDPGASVTHKLTEKANATVFTEITRQVGSTTTVTLQPNNNHQLYVATPFVNGDRLMISTDADSDFSREFICGLNFMVGATVPTMIFTTSSYYIHWLGTDCSLDTSESIPKPIFTPQPNQTYDIIFYYNGNYVVGLVNGYPTSIIN